LIAERKQPVAFSENGCRFGARTTQATLTGSSAQNDLTGALYLPRDRLAVAKLSLDPGHMRLVFGGDAVVTLL
jgi:hypothetical protein